MSVSQSYLDFVVEQLGLVPDVTSKRMFGGVGLYSRDAFFAVIDDDQLYFKVEAQSVAEYERAGMTPFQPMPDRPPMKYYTVPISVLEDPEALAEWAARAIAVSGTPKKRRRRAG